jgi:ABC-type dipeptide/oligopeptide/nickel transport system permease component
MGRYILRRIIYAIAVLLVVSAITFILMHAIPGGPFTAEKSLPEQVLKNLEKRYNLNAPLYRQYLDYLNQVFIPTFTTTPPDDSSPIVDHLIQFKIGPVWFQWMNFGPSYRSLSRSVADIMRQQLPVSAQLGIMALFVGLTIGLPFGIMSALKHNTIVDYIGMGIAIIGVSVPVIVLGPILISILGIKFGWLPPTGWGAKPPYIFGIFPRSLTWDYFKYAIMPAFALGIGSSAILARLTRASLLQVLGEDFIRTARAKGLSERLVIIRHALKNSLIPVVTVLGPIFAAIITGSFVTESIFGIPGMGQYFITSITNRDYPVIMGTILLYVVILVIANLLVDITYAFLDPRIRYE